MRKCENCIYSVPVRQQVFWNDELEKGYQEETVLNEYVKKQNERAGLFEYHRSTSHIFASHKAAYEDDQRCIKEKIECRCMPMFIQRDKEDLCGQWSER
jgi:hypothetical protein